MYYELKHPMRADYYDIQTRRDLTFMPHIHYCYELIVVLSGELKLTIDGCAYLMRSGDAALIFPYQVHSGVTETSSHHLYCVFSDKLVSSFSHETEGKIPVNPLFHCPDFWLDRLELLQGGVESLCIVKGVLYSLCGLFDRFAVYTKAKASASDLLLYRIFAFVGDHYKDDCSLRQLSDEIAYDYAYLSKFFKRIVGISYSDYVTQYRVNESCYLLRSTDKSVLEISEECGFKSLRSLNRNFREQIHLTPTEYRAARQKTYVPENTSNDIDGAPEPPDAAQHGA